MAVSPKSRATSIATLAAFALLLGVPFLLRPEQARQADPLVLVAFSPHDEGVKWEFAHAFSNWHAAKFGRPVRIEWQDVGGGSIPLYVESQFAVRSTPDDGIGVDVMFGGGDFNHRKFKTSGWLVKVDPPADYAAHVPADLNGVPLFDPDGCWFGACLSQFGILANRVVCDKLHLPVPATWADLADARFRDQLALADPNISGSAKVCYEMVLQKHGWSSGWPMLTDIAANARYFGSSSTQVALDVSRCEAAGGLVIDYYGRTQVDFTGRDRLVYTSPAGATATTADPISVFRGAPHRELAERFVRFVLSADGQKLWMGKVGAPGGPARFALYRPPILPTLYEDYADQMLFVSNPYTDTSGFNMDARALGRRFGLLGVLMKAAFIDNADLLKRAADAARAAGPGSPADAAYRALPFDEAAMWERARKFNEATPGERETIAQELSRFFREKYERALAAR